MEVEQKVFNPYRRADVEALLGMTVETAIQQSASEVETDGGNE